MLAKRKRGQHLQRSQFAHLFHRDRISCLYHALTMRKIYGDHLMDDVFNAFTNPVSAEHVICQFAEQYSTILLNQMIDDLLRTGLLIQEPSDDVRLYKTLYYKGLHQNSIQHMYLLPTSACNFRCSYCFVEDDQRYLTSSFMDTATAKTAILTFEKICTCPASVTIYGGEPLLNTKTTLFSLRFLRHIQAEGLFAKGLEISLITNGSLVNAKIVRVFQKTRPSIGVSIDGPQLLHDAARKDKRGDGTFAAALKGFRLLQDAGLTPGISCTLNAFTISHIDEIVDFIIRELKPKSMGFNLLLPRIGNEAQCSKLDYAFAVEQLIAAFKRLREAGIYEDRMMRRIKPFIRLRPHLKDCMGVGGQVVITPTGKVGPCQAFLGINDDRYFPLDVQRLAAKGEQLSSLTIYEEPLFDEWCHRFPLNMKQCADCFAIAVCGGGCPYAAAVTGKSIWEIDERVCYQSKNILEWLIWDTYDHMEQKR